MKIIIFTPENIFPKEAQMIALLLENGVDRVHIRKPNINDVRNLLKELPNWCFHKISIHQHIELLKSYPEIGFHFSKKHHQFNKDIYANILLNFKGCLSTGVHHWSEINLTNKYSYQFISPVFDSISKVGYSKNKLLQKIPNHCKKIEIYALGGIDANTIIDADKMQYKGVGVLGAIWRSKQPLQEYLNLKKEVCQE